MDAIDLVIRAAGAAVCTLVVLACICRVDMLHAGRHRAGWLLLYTFFAPFAGGVLIDLATGRDVDWYASLGIAGVALHIIQTRRLWRHGPPAETEVRP